MIAAVAERLRDRGVPAEAIVSEQYWTAAGAGPG